MHALLRGYMTPRVSHYSSGDRIIHQDLIMKLKDLQAEFNSEVVKTLRRRDPPIKLGIRSNVIKFNDALYDLEAALIDRLFELS